MQDLSGEVHRWRGSDPDNYKCRQRLISACKARDVLPRASGSECRAWAPAKICSYASTSNAALKAHGRMD